MGGFLSDFTLASTGFRPRYCLSWLLERDHWTELGGFFGPFGGFAGGCLPLCIWLAAKSAPTSARKSNPACAPTCNFPLGPRSEKFMLSLTCFGGGGALGGCFAASTASRDCICCCCAAA